MNLKRVDSTMRVGNERGVFDPFQSISFSQIILR
jgi:hypothetical protein